MLKSTSSLSCLRGWLRSAAALILAAALCHLFQATVNAQAVSADPGSPSMTGVTDVTGGQRYLLEDDDLALLQVNMTNGQLATNVVTMDTSNSTVSNPSSYQISSYSNPPFTTATYPNAASSPASLGTGRMFSMAQDVVAAISPAQNSGTWGWRFNMWDPYHSEQITPPVNSQFAPYGTVTTQVVMGDFNGDGFDDALVFYSSFSTSQGGPQWGMKVFTAADPTQESAGLNQGPELYGTFTGPVAGAIAVGDFNNDGRDEIAALSSADNQTILFYSVDPATLTITQTQTLKLKDQFIGGPQGTIAMAAGRFRDCGTPTCMTNADLAVVGDIVSQSQFVVSVVPVQITPQSNGTYTATEILQSGPNPYFNFPAYKFSNLIAHAAPLGNWPKNTLEQLVVGVVNPMSTTKSQGLVNIGTFLQIGTSTGGLGPFDWESSTNVTPNDDLLVDVEVGNFDNQNSDGTPNQGWQVETYTIDSGKPNIRIYDVSVPSPFPPLPGGPTGNWLAQQSDYSPSSSVVSTSNLVMGLVVPGDFQGRSMRLGSPTIMTIPTQVQPDLVLGMPPMHADWVTPPFNVPSQAGCSSAQVPCYFNVSVLPTIPPSAGNWPTNTGFFSNSSTTTVIKHTSTTSWGISVQQNVSSKVTFGDGLSSSTIALKNSTQYMHDHNVARSFNTYSGKSSSTQVVTQLSDELFFTVKRMNVFYYPVIGQTTCPDDTTTCSSNEQVPLYVEFSVPDQVQNDYAPAANQWWYQPVHQPDNILSYPYNQQQMQTGFSDTLQLLAPAEPNCVSSTQNIQSSTQWSSGGSSGTTVGSANAFSDEVGFSYSAKAGISGVVSGKFTYGLDVSGHTSLSSLNETTASLSESNGVLIQQVGNNTNDAWPAYGWSNYVFGLNNSQPTGQTAAQIVPVDNPFTGPMFVGFTVNVAGCQATSSWWQTTYEQAPDIALNHPSPLTWTKSTQTATFSPADQTGVTPLFSQPFYQMSGFFITEQSAPTPAPNLPSATAGDQLTLTARVYNYSMVNTSVPVHVRIYGQLYCASGSTTEKSCVPPSGQPACTGGRLCGNGFEIGETTIEDIPGYQMAANNYAANWTTANVSFDSTNYGGDNLVFWVVVWMQDASGKIVPEMPDHGLTAVPSASITNILQEPVQKHSNNVGLYGMFHQFYVAPAATLPGATATPGTLQSASLITYPQASLYQRLPIAMTVQAGAGAPADGVNIAYYDGNPGKGGTLLDVQRIEHIEPGLSYTHQESFVPGSCGTHSLYATAWLDGQAQVAGSSSVNVTANTTNLIQDLITRTQNAPITSAPLQSNLLAFLNAGATAFQNGQLAAAEQVMAMYLQEVANAAGSSIPQSAASPLIGEAGDLLGCGQLGFSISGQPSTVLLSSGQTAKYSLAVTPIGGFTGPVLLACSGAPAKGACTISAQTVTLDGTTQQLLTVSVTTGAGSTAAAGVGGMSLPPGLRWLQWLAILVIALLAAFVGRASRRYALWLSLLLVFVVTGMMGCGSGASNTQNGQNVAPGTYTISVSGTSGNQTQNAKLLLIVTR